MVELGGTLGIMNCLTDLGGGKGPGRKFIKDINWQNFQLSPGAYLSFNVKDVLALRLETCFGNVKAYDSVLSSIKNNSHGRYYRNLNFRSKVNEYGITIEFHPLMLKDYSNSTPPRFSPYVLAGIAKFNFNPETYFHGRWVELHPLRLEGQGFAEYKERTPYRLTATSYPVGLGLRYELNSHFILRFETVYRFTSTDYLDDVCNPAYINPSLFDSYLLPAQAAMAKQLYFRGNEIIASAQPSKDHMRGELKNNDSYFTFSLKLGVLLNRNLNR